ncbi:MAG: YitT family protein [Deltaproteobacteria bacterium]|nr:YitT family protein [Deltaproteobacteria bacterium]
MKKIPLNFLLRQTCAITLGAFLSATSINLFLVPHHFVKGGVSGLALLISYLAPFPVWLWVAIINVPIFLAGFRILGRSFVLGSLYGTVIFTFFIFATQGLAQLHFLKNPMLAALFSGVLGGIGVGTTLRVNGSLGGTDIIAAIINKKLSISIGTISFIINGVVVILTGVFYGAEIAAFALLAIFIEGMALDKTVRGIDTSKAIMIITTKPDEIAEQILKKLMRGVTFLQGEGAWEQSPRKILYCVVSLRQLARVKYYVREADPKAFMSVADVSEVMGKGFRPNPF